MASSTSVRLKKHEQAYLNATDKSLSTVVRKTFNQRIPTEARNVCVSCAEIMFSMDSGVSPDDEEQTLMDSCLGEKIPQYFCESCVHKFTGLRGFKGSENLNNEVAPVTIYPFSTNAATDARQGVHEFGQGEADTHILYSVEFMTIQHAGDTRVDAIVPAILKQFRTDATPAEFLAYGYLRGVAMLEYLSTVASNMTVDTYPDWLNNAIENVLLWLAELEQALTDEVDAIETDDPVIAGPNTKQQQLTNAIKDLQLTNTIKGVVDGNELNGYPIWLLLPYSEDGIDPLKWGTENTPRDTPLVAPATAALTLKPVEDNSFATFLTEAVTTTPPNKTTQLKINDRGNITLNARENIVLLLAATIYNTVGENLLKETRGSETSDLEYGFEYSGNSPNVGETVTVTGIVTDATVTYSYQCPETDCEKLLSTTSHNHGECPIHGATDVSSRDTDAFGFKAFLTIDTHTDSHVIELRKTDNVERLFGVTQRVAFNYAKDRMSSDVVGEELESEIIGTEITCEGLWTGTEIIYDGYSLIDPAPDPAL